ncbi:MAG: hypothetical protein H6Q90_2112 [Deltaproteobacteria bacterium]|nr:hypothetical protein [Deltaproteobacteria bacterium]
MTDHPIENRTTKEKRLEVGTWGVFFVWMGIALLASLPSGAWFLGVGLLVLGAQVARRGIALRIEGFWILAGVVFVLGGILELAQIKIDIALIPILCIVAGAGLVARAVLRRTAHHA